MTIELISALLFLLDFSVWMNLQIRILKSALIEVPQMLVWSQIYVEEKIKRRRLF